MRPARGALAALVLLAVAGCGDDGTGSASSSQPTTSPTAAEPTAAELLTGAWTGVAVIEEGVREPVRGRNHVLVLRADGTSALVSGTGEPDLATVCESPADQTWELTADESAIEVRFGPEARPGDEPDVVWTIETLDSASFTFEEGTDLFEFERLGSCD